VAEGVSGGRVYFRVVETADGHHLNGLVVPYALPPEWRTTDWTKTLLHAWRRRVFLRTTLYEFDLVRIVQEPGHDRRASHLATPATMAIGRFIRFACCAITSCPAQTPTLDAFWFVHQQLPMIEIAPILTVCRQACSNSTVNIPAPKCDRISSL